MNKQQLLADILDVVQTVKEDGEKLEVIHKFLFNEIYEESEEDKIPDKYKKVVTEIANSLLAGFICFFDANTLEVEEVPAELINDPEEFEMVTGETMHSLGLNNEKWTESIRIEPMSSHDSFEVMEYFVEQLNNKDLQGKLVYALNKSRPLANFKNLVDSSDYRQQWFDYRETKWELHAWREIEDSLPTA